MSICVRTHTVLLSHESSLWHSDFDLRLSTGEQILFELCLNLPEQRDPSDMCCELPCTAAQDTWGMDVSHNLLRASAGHTPLLPARQSSI